MDRLDRLDRRAGLVKQRQVHISQRDLWSEMLHPPVLWLLLLAVGLTAAAAVVETALLAVAGPLLVGLVALVAVQRVRSERAKDDQQ